MEVERHNRRQEDHVTEQPSEAGAEQELDVTQATIEALAVKLDGFGGTLEDEERLVLAAVLNTGMDVLSSEVEGFGGEAIEIHSWSFGVISPLGTTVRRYDIVGAFPKKLEFGQMKAGDGG